MGAAVRTAGGLFDRAEILRRRRQTESAARGLRLGLPGNPARHHNRCRGGERYDQPMHQLSPYALCCESSRAPKFRAFAGKISGPIIFLRQGERKSQYGNRTALFTAS
jgi:hypothetical protein